MDQFGPIQTTLDERSLDKFGGVRTILDEFGIGSWDRMVVCGVGNFAAGQSITTRPIHSFAYTRFGAGVVLT